MEIQLLLVTQVINGNITVKKIQMLPSVFTL